MGRDWKNDQQGSSIKPMNKKLSKKLFHVAPDVYGANYTEHLLEQYRICVEMADHISSRRNSANSFLLTVNTFLLSLYSLSVPLLPDRSTNSWKVLLPLAGILVSVTWWALIRSYRKLNSAKFQVLHELETHLPAAPFDREWELVGRGTAFKDYIPLTHLETWVPSIFGAIYSILFLRLLWS